MVKVIVSVTSHPSGACFIYRYITKYQCMLSVLTIQLKQSIFPKACLPSIGKQGHFIYLSKRFRKNLCTFSENLYKQNFFVQKMTIIRVPSLGNDTTPQRNFADISYNNIREVFITNYIPLVIS